MALIAPPTRTPVRVRVRASAALAVAGLVVAGLVVAATSGGVALLAAGGAPSDLPPGIADPGPVVGWGAPLVDLLCLVAAAATVGALLVPTVLSPGDVVSSARAGRTARRAAATWTVVALLGHVLTVCDTLGVPLSGVPVAALLPWSAAGVITPALVVAPLAALVASGAGAAAGRRRAAALVPVALAAALVSPVAGHVASAEDAGLSLGGLVVHVAAALVWVGGLAALLLLVRADDALAVAVPRFSALALVSYTALAGSGLVAVSASLPFSGVAWQTAWASGYAAVVAAKAVVLVVLGVLGARHRRVTVPRVVAREPRAFRRLAVAELGLMAVGAGLATALARTPPPARGVVGHDGATVERLSPAVLVTTWRPDAVVLVVLGTAVTAYVLAQRRARTGGRDWPRSRTRWFLAGAATAGAALCSALATYAPLLLSVHLAQQLLLLLVVPPLLLMGRPVVLLRDATGREPPTAARRLLAASPTGALAACVLLTVVHRTPVMSLSLGSPWWHLVVVALTLTSGLVLWWPVLGAEHPERRPVAEWAGWLLPVVACLGVLALQLRDADDLLASAWFLELRLGWVEPAADQRLAGALAGLAALAVACVAAAAVVAATSRASRARPAHPGPDRGQGPSSTVPRRSSASTAP